MLLHPLSVFLGIRLPTDGFIKQASALSQPLRSHCLHTPNKDLREPASSASDCAKWNISPSSFPPTPIPKHLLVYEYQPTDDILQESRCFFISLNQLKSALSPPPPGLKGNTVSIITGTPYFQDLGKGT